MEFGGFSKELYEELTSGSEGEGAVQMPEKKEVLKKLFSETAKAASNSSLKVQGVLDL